MKLVSPNRNESIDIILNIIFCFFLALYLSVLFPNYGTINFIVSLSLPVFLITFIGSIYVLHKKSNDKKNGVINSIVEFTAGFGVTVLSAEYLPFRLILLFNNNFQTDVVKGLIGLVCLFLILLLAIRLRRKRLLEGVILGGFVPFLWFLSLLFLK